MCRVAHQVFTLLLSRLQYGSFEGLNTRLLCFVPKYRCLFRRRERSIMSAIAAGGALRGTVGKSGVGAFVQPILRDSRRFVSPLLLVGLWQVGSMLGLIPARTLAAPSTILMAAWGLTVSGDLPYNLLVSLRRVMIGLGIGISVGGMLPIIAGLSRRGEDLVDAPMEMLRTLPFLALVPLFILWFGIGEVPKIGLVAFGAAFPIYVTLFAGIRGVDPKLVEAGRVF